MSSVLIVDDNLSSARTLAQLLRLEGIPADTASSGREMFQRLSERTPDLILLDVMLPETTGPDLLRTLHDMPEYRSLPVVMYSALESAEVQSQSMALGARDYLLKGTAWPELLFRIRRQLSA